MDVDINGLAVFARAFAVGLAVAAPVGPMALLCIGRCLRFGAGNGLLFGSGIAAADATYATVAVAGLAAVSTTLIGLTPWVKGIGSLILLWLGAKTLSAPLRTGADTPPPARPWRAFATAYALTIANPPTIVFFAGAFAALGPIASDRQAALFPLGVLFGSMSWWLILVTAVRHGRARLTPPVLAWINRLAGAALVGLALFGLADLAG